MAVKFEILFIRNTYMLLYIDIDNIFTMQEFQRLFSLFTLHGEKYLNLHNGLISELVLLDFNSKNMYGRTSFA